MHFEGIEHALARDDDLLGLLFDGERANERGNFFGCLPLGKLAQTLLTSPDARVDDLEEELARARIEDEDGAVDGLGHQVAVKGLVNGHTVNVGVVHEPDRLVGEELSICVCGKEKKKFFFKSSKKVERIFVYSFAS